ncbi:MAG TPA: HD domain-containing protein [Firmicutes bacterium]|nr:HD domain-containing protein [Bacillota bacterium]
MSQGLGHYLGEVLHHLDPRPLPASRLAWALRHLSPAEQRLFCAMRPSDQRHCWAVAQAVVRKEDLSLRERAILIRAALLHDVGKAGVPNGLAVRTVNALWRNKVPLWLPSFFREAVLTLRAHAGRGASRLREAGTDLAVVTLVRWHEAEEPPEELPDGLRLLLTILQRADEEN